MKIADVVKRNDHELAELIRTEREALAKAVVDSRTKESKNVKILSAHKKTIAQALTVARQREIAGKEQAS